MLGTILIIFLILAWRASAMVSQSRLGLPVNRGPLRQLNYRKYRFCSGYGSSVFLRPLLPDLDFRHG